jgi:hypothetical protein
MIYFIYLIALFLITAIVTIIISNFIRFKTISRKTRTVTVILFFLLLIPCTIDLYYYCSGGISKLTDITITDAYSSIHTFIL